MAFATTSGVPSWNVHKWRAWSCGRGCFWTLFVLICKRGNQHQHWLPWFHRLTSSPLTMQGTSSGSSACNLSRATCSPARSGDPGAYDRYAAYWARIVKHRATYHGLILNRRDRESSKLGCSHGWIGMGRSDDILTISEAIPEGSCHGDSHTANAFCQRFLINAERRQLLIWSPEILTWTWLISWICGAIEPLENLSTNRSLSISKRYRQLLIVYLWADPILYSGRVFLLKLCSNIIQLCIDLSYKCWEIPNKIISNVLVACH